MIDLTDGPCRTLRSVVAHRPVGITGLEPRANFHLEMRTGTDSAGFGPRIHLELKIAPAEPYMWLRAGHCIRA